MFEGMMQDLKQTMMEETYKAHALHKEEYKKFGEEMIIVVNERNAIIADQQLLIESKDESIKEQDDFIDELLPKAEFHDIVAISKGNVDIEAFAKMVTIGRNTMYKVLRDQGFLIDSYKDHNLPYQKWINAGIFEVNERIVLRF